jgi:putative transposase
MAMARLRRLARARGVLPVRVWEASSPLSRYRDNAETRRRVKVIGRLPGERSCLSLVWAVLDRASRGWRGVQQTLGSIRLLADLRRELFDQASTDAEVIAETAVTPAA